MQSSVAQTSADETTPAKNASSLTSHAENNGEQSCKRIKLDESAAVETVVGQEVANEAPQQEKAIGQQVGGQEEATPPVVRVSKKKYALLIGYSGEGYFGLQRNPSIKNGQFRTIEDEIVDALVKIDAIPQNHADEMFKMSFQRAARTDKGVSAAANLISLKMEMHDDTLSRLNSMLPKQIRAFGFNKTTQSFDAKNNCDGRTYTYILPTFAFCPIEEILTESFRCPEEIIQNVNKMLNKLTGTHNFHNFTSGRKYTDPSANRYILTFECSKPFLKDGYEFVVIRVRGQSFMLHQIRKMIGMTIAMVRGFAANDSLDLCWTANKVDVPKAPALGLMLDKLHYDKYNRKFGADGIHKSLEWTELSDEIESFKHEHIFSNIIRKEIEQKS